MHRIYVAATTATVRIEVLDANDETPVFEQTSLFAAVEEEAKFGTFVTRLAVRLGFVFSIIVTLFQLLVL